MPAEWAPHTRCWMAWPCRESLWGPHLQAARQAYAEVARAIAAFEPVTMIARSDLTADASLTLGQGMSILPLDHDDSWTRDTAPTFVITREGKLAAVDWRFNGWGGAHPDHARDARMARRVAEHVGAEIIASTLCTEGGAIHVDGEGTALVCTASILDPGRNPSLEKTDVEAELQRTLGVSRTIWLEHGLIDDETAGHVDNLACFAAPGKVLALDPAGAAADDRAGLEANLAALRQAEGAAGRKLEVIALPSPAMARREDGRRATRSYVNFYVANDAVIMPAFDDSADVTAQKLVQAAFPDRQVIQIDADVILQGGGGIHCITQQQPAVP
ncbi:MAG: agmatine deiminase family protein [Geminicoccaceae bacterium]|nr:agmatine deiminase family protein [Geminicoccaceae bacterium]